MGLVGRMHYNGRLALAVGAVTIGMALSGCTSHPTERYTAEERNNSENKKEEYTPRYPSKDWTFGMMPR